MVAQHGHGAAVTRHRPAVVSAPLPVIAAGYTPVLRTPVQSGLLSNPATWGGEANKPQFGDNIHVPNGIALTLDEPGLWGSYPDDDGTSPLNEFAVRVDGGEIIFDSKTYLAGPIIQHAGAVTFRGGSRTYFDTTGHPDPLNQHYGFRSFPKYNVVASTVWRTADTSRSNPAVIGIRSGSGYATAHVDDDGRGGIVRTGAGRMDMVHARIRDFGSESIDAFNYRPAGSVIDSFRHSLIDCVFERCGAIRSLFDNGARIDTHEVYERTSFIDSRGPHTIEMSASQALGLDGTRRIVDCFLDKKARFVGTADIDISGTFFCEAFEAVNSDDTFAPSSGFTIVADWDKDYQTINLPWGFGFQDWQLLSLGEAVNPHFFQITGGDGAQTTQSDGMIAYGEHSSSVGEIFILTQNGLNITENTVFELAGSIVPPTTQGNAYGAVTLFNGPPVTVLHKLDAHCNTIYCDPEQPAFTFAELVDHTGENIAQIYDNLGWGENGILAGDIGTDDPYPNELEYANHNAYTYPFNPYNALDVTYSPPAYQPPEEPDTAPPEPDVPPSSDPTPTSAWALEFAPEFGDTPTTTTRSWAAEFEPAFGD